MEKKRLIIVGIILILIIIGSFVIFKYFFTGTTETILDLKNGSESIYATRNVEEKTAELDMRSIFNLSNMDQNSLTFKNFAVSICSNVQRYHHDEEYRANLEKNNKEFGIEKTDIEINLDEFLEGYALTRIKMNFIDLNENRLFECTITGPNGEDNLIGVFSSDQSRFSFKLSESN